MQIIEQLQQRYPTNHIDIKTLLADFFPHIRSERYFIQQVKSGSITIKLSRLTMSKKSPYIIYLTDLASYLDHCEQTA